VLELLTPLCECTAFFYNPNVEPLEEHEKRKSELEKLLVRNSLLNNVCLIVSEYENDIFSGLVADLRGGPEGGERCKECYRLRLGATAVLAAGGGYDFFATTMTVSPHKNATHINDIGNMLAEEHGVKYMSSDYKKNDGFKRSVELAKEYGLYRQSYCGCKSGLRIGNDMNDIKGINSGTYEKTDGDSQGSSNDRENPDASGRYTKAKRVRIERI